MIAVEPRAVEFAASRRRCWRGRRHGLVVAAHVVGQRRRSSRRPRPPPPRTPMRVSRRMVASLIAGSSTCCAQPASSATRTRRVPDARVHAAAVDRAGGGRRAGAMASMARRRLKQHGLRAAAARPTAGPAAPPAAPAGTARDAAAPRPAARAAAGRARAGGRWLDVGPGVVDQVHVVHAGRAGGHAGQAGQAAINVPHHLLGGRAAGFQHVLDQVDAAARAVEFVAEQHEGRAGRGAQAAMHAGAQHLVGRGDGRVAQLLGGEMVSACRLQCPRTCGRG